MWRGKEEVPQARGALQADSGTARGAHGAALPYSDSDRSEAGFERLAPFRIAERQSPTIASRLPE